LILLISSFANAQQRIKEYTSNQVVYKGDTITLGEDLVLMEILYLFKSGWAVGVTHKVLVQLTVA
jgi:hypothetical protein